MMESSEKVGKSKSWKLRGLPAKILLLLVKEGHGLKADTLASLLKCKSSTLYYHLKRLQDAELVEHVFPSYFLTFQGKSLNIGTLLEGSKIQGHKFSFIVHLLDKPDWWERRWNKVYLFPDYQHKKVDWGNSPFLQLMNQTAVLQTFSDSIIIMLRKKFHGIDVYDAYLSAMEEFLAYFAGFQDMLKFKFFKDGIPTITIKTHHYVRLRDAIAQHCKKTGNKFEVRIYEGTPKERVALYVDYSDPLGVEAASKNHNIRDLTIYRNFVKDLEEKPHYPASETKSLLDTMGQVLQQVVQDREKSQAQIDYLAANIKSHVAAIKTLGKNAAIMGNTTNNLKEVIYELKNEVSGLNRRRYRRKSVPEYIG